MRREGRRRRESRWSRFLRLIGIEKPGPPAPDEDLPPGAGVREPRRPRPSSGSAAAVLDPPTEQR
jgi:hypothetical protein